MPPMMVNEPTIFCPNCGARHSYKWPALLPECPHPAAECVNCMYGPGHKSEHCDDYHRILANNTPESNIMGVPSGRDRYSSVSPFLSGMMRAMEVEDHFTSKGLSKKVWTEEDTDKTAARSLIKGCPGKRSARSVLEMSGFSTTIIDAVIAAEFGAEPVATTTGAVGGALGGTANRVVGGAGVLNGGAGKKDTTSDTKSSSSSSTFVSLTGTDKDTGASTLEQKRRATVQEVAEHCHAGEHEFECYCGSTFSSGGNFTTHYEKCKDFQEKLAEVENEK